MAYSNKPAADKSAYKTRVAAKAQAEVAYRPTFTPVSDAVPTGSVRISSGNASRLRTKTLAGR